MTPTQSPSRFIALNLALSLIRALVPICAKLRTRDRELEKQLRTAAHSIAQNLAEGRRRRGKDRIHLWRIADGSASETQTSLWIAQAWGYVTDGEVEHALALVDRVLAITWTLTN